MARRALLSGVDPAHRSHRAALLRGVDKLAEAFGDGILAGDPEATGTFRWPGIAYLQSEVTYTVSGGAHYHFGDSQVSGDVLYGSGLRLTPDLPRALGLPKTTFWRRATALGLLSKSTPE